MMLQDMPLPVDSPNTVGYLAALIIGGVVTILTSYIVNVWSKKAESKKDIRIAELESKVEDCDNKDKAMAELKEALSSLKDLAEKHRRVITEITAQMETVNVAYGIIYNHYEREFKDDPEKLAPLQELKPIMDTLTEFKPQ